MLNKFVLVAGLALSALVSQAASAECFDFVGGKPTAVGPVTLWGPATSVCVYTVNGFGHKYYSLRFSDAQGDLAQLASQEEIMGRCPGFCRVYTLTSGNADGRNVDPDSTSVAFQVEGPEGTLTISHPTAGERTYRVKAQRSNDVFDGQTLTGNVDGETFKVTLSSDLAKALLVQDGARQVLAYNPHPARQPRCICRVYEAGSTSVAVEFRGQQAVGVYWN